MSKETIEKIEKEYKKLDWKDPNASAIYWTCIGLNENCKKGVEANLRQIRFLAFMQLSRKDVSFAPFALKEMKEANRLFPNKSLDTLIKSFAKKHNLNNGN